jgi:hypothetical protein
MPMSRARLVFIGAALACLGWPMPASADSLTYTNARFGTSVTFPAELFDSRMDPPANGDGMTWTSTDGASLAVYASNNALMVDPAQLLENVVAERPEISYSQSGPDWVVISGIEDATIFYERWVFGGDDVIHGVLLRYPESLRSTFDPLVGDIAGSLSAP